MVRTLMMAALLLAACKKSAKPDCDGAGKAMQAAAAEAAAKATDPTERETMTRLGPALASTIVLRCTQDGWTAAATDCVKGVKGDAKFSDCETKLTAEQRDKMRVAMSSIDGSAPAGSNAVTPPAGPAPDCAGVEAAMTKFWNDKVAAAKDDTERKSYEAVRVTARDRIGKHCKEDMWSAEAADCFKAVTNGDFASCESKLTPMQVSALRGDVPRIEPAPAASGSAAPAPDGSAAAPEASAAPEGSAAP